MNSQPPTPDDGQPTEPVPPRGQDQHTDPLLPPPAAGPYAGSPAPGQSTDFFTWIRSHGIQRGRDRWIGGVSSGIANRMGLDPLIVRGIFIVLTLFAGVGVLLYGIAWAFLPEPDGRIHVQEAGAGGWSSGMTGALVTTVVGLTGLGGGFWGWSRNGFGGFLWTVFWVGGAIYFIYYLTQRNKARNRVPMNATPQPAGAGGNNAFSAPYPRTTYPTAPYTSAYAATDGGGNYGGYQPPQGPVLTPQVRPSGPGTPAVAITAGAALLVGGGLKALDVANVINLGDTPNGIVWAGGAAVVALGIVIAGLRGKTAGILSFFAVAALITGGIYNMVGNGDRVRFTEVDWTPVSIEQARDGYDVTAGRGNLDLTKMNLTPPLPSDVVIPLDVTASNVTVVIPDGVPVKIQADMTMGNLNEGNTHRGGNTSGETRYNTEKPGASLIVEIGGTFSNITIKEGN